MQNQKTVEQLEQELEHFKRAIHEWVMYLSRQDKDVSGRIALLERRLAKLEFDSHLRV